MTYRVYYKLQGQWFWRKISKVKGDFVSNDIHTTPRVLILHDESRIEIPIDGTLFKFSKDRFLVIKQNMEKESGQKI